jgi:hypothetical protein
MDTEYGSNLGSPEVAAQSKKPHQITGGALLNN